jgi:hypothetical protein
MRSMSLPSTLAAPTMARPACAPDYGTDYYAAFVVDPDGYRIEAYFGG